MHLDLNIMDMYKTKKSMVNWTHTLRTHANYEGFTYFTTSFLSVCYSIINSSPSPCIFPKDQYLLQLSKDVKVGDWFQFQDYDEIRLYGVEVSPYRFPTFVPMRLFSLEFI